MVPVPFHLAGRDRNERIAIFVKLFTDFHLFLTLEPICTTELAHDSRGVQKLPVP